VSLLTTNNHSVALSYGEPPSTLNDSLKDSYQRSTDELQALLSKPLAHLTDADKLRIREITQAKLKHFLENGHRTRRANTWRALMSRWAKFESWCLTNNLTPLPASPEVVATFIEYHQASSYTTLSQYAWAINSFHVECGLLSPVSSKTVQDKQNEIRIVKLESGGLAQEQATPFRLHHLQMLIESYGESERLLDKRNLALLNIAYESLLRESELLRIKVGHLKSTFEGDYVLSVPYTKTNDSGEEEVVNITPLGFKLIQRYIQGAGLTKEDYLFQPIGRSNKVSVQAKPMNTRTVDRVFLWAFESLAIDLHSAWSGHSARIGAAQDLLAAGYSIAQIQENGRWKSPMMVLRYGKDIKAKESAMAKMLAERR
jgi:site-specific recombinase XerC